MKPSRYNFFFEVDGGAVLAFNSLTTILARLSTDEFSILKEYYTNPRDNNFNTQERSEFKNDLIKARFLIADDCEELAQIEGLHSWLKSQPKSIGLTIVPTLDCNFRCTYCYSYARPERMRPEVQDALLRFVEARLPGSMGVTVSWYGGEPTLCLDIIETLSDRLRGLCDQHGVGFLRSGMVTNGYLLSKAAAQRLKAAGICSLQITLDGDRETHNQRRPLCGGGATFNRILDNVAACQEDFDIQIRINIDRDNAATASAVLDALAARGLQGMKVYFGHVRAFTEACASIASTCLSDLEFGKINLELTRQAVARGFLSVRYPQLQIGGVCGADSKNNFLIAPDGMLYKCWTHASLGKEYSVGSILTNQISPEQAENLNRYMNWSPLEDQKCKECRVLPICMGGCPYLRLTGPDGANCSDWRHFLLDTLALHYKLGQFAQATEPSEREREREPRR